MTRVLMAAEVIAPGGGPAGYTYNLLQGFAAAAPTEGLDVIGEGVTEKTRYRGLGESGPEPRWRQLVRSARDEWLPLPALYRAFNAARWWTSERDRAKRKAYAAADVIVFQGYQPSIRASWARRRGKTLLYMPHSPSAIADEIRMLEIGRTGHMSGARYRFMQWDEKRLLSTVDLVVLASPGAAEQYDAAYPAVMRKVERRFVGSGVDRPRPASAAVPKAQMPTVLFVGRYVGHKGYDLFLEAAEVARHRGLDARFLTLGAGPDAGASPDVEDLGWSEDPHSHIRDADLVVVPNRIAYFDLLPLEAAALGKPLVLTRVGGNVDQLAALPDSVGAAPTAESVADAVAEALRQLELDPGFGSRNAAKWEAEFTTAALASRWTDLLRAASECR